MTMLLERTKLSDTDLLRTFHDLRAQYGGDFALMFTALHLEMEARVAELELRLEKLEAKRK